MLKTSLLEILRTFTPEEVKKFEDFVSSPYHNKKSTVVSLYKHIKKYAPEFNSPKLEKEKVWNALYPGKEFNYGVFKNLIYDLTHHAEKFITFELYQKNDFDRVYDLLDSLSERQVIGLFKSKFNSEEKNLVNLQKNKKIGALEYHDTMSRIYLLKLCFRNDFDRNSGMIDDLEQHTFFKASEILYSIFRVGVFSCIFADTFNYKKGGNILVSFLKKADSDNLISEFLESLKPNSLTTYNIINTYYKCYISYSDSSSFEKYYDFKNAMELNAQNFSKDDKFNLYNALMLCHGKLTVPKVKEIMDIVKLKIRDDVIVNPNGFLGVSAFASYIEVGISAEDPEFIDDFTKRFLKFIPKDSRENMLEYSLAHLYFVKRQFEKSLEKILTIDLEIFHMKYYLKNLQMMNYYELNDYDSFLLLQDSYKHFLSKNTSIVEDWKKKNDLFINSLHKLFKLKENFDEFELVNLKKEVVCSYFTRKQWLLKKVDELQKKNNN